MLSKSLRNARQLRFLLRKPASNTHINVSILIKISSATNLRLFSTDIQRIRNVGIVAHIDAGKTTTTENMLFVAGETKSLGRVDAGDTVTDFLPQERERGITINSAIIQFVWKSALINLIDTPGHVDFTIEVERSCRVLDGVVLVIDAVAGVQAQTKTVWRQARKQNIPAIAFINKMDRDGASFERAIKSIKDNLHANVVPIQLPILGVDSNFIGVVDLISMDTILWGTSPTSNSRAVIHPVLSKLDDSNSLLYESALSARKRMVEAIAEVDELFMEIYFAFEANLTDIPITDILSAIKRQCLRGVLIPAICGASLKSKGIQPLLDSIVTFLPSPLERPPVIARDTKNSVSKSISPTSMDLCALAFKVVYDEARGPLVFARVYSGTLPARQVLHNSTRNIKERASQILRVSADDLEHIDGIGAGEVACIVGLKKTLSGDTLVVEQGPLQNYVLEGLHLPKSVFALALEPEKSSQQDDLEKALNILCMEDPSLHVDVDKESGQTLIKGIGELHLEIVCDKLRRQFKIEVTTGRAYVAFRESLQLIENEDEVFAYEYDKVIGSKRLYAGMSFVITKRADIGSPELDYKVVSEQLTNEERVCLEESFQGCISRGPVGYPVVGFNVKIIEIDKNIHTCSGSLRACLSMAMNTVLKGPLQCLFEPLMSLEVYLPTEYLGDVLSDLSMRRRGLVREVKTEDASSIIIAHVPLVTMLGYASAIRSMTQGEGSFAMEYLEHVQVDDALAMDLTGHHT